MTQTTPGWYPDPNGRYAQRYHDGTNWTEHVADAAGNRTTDPQGTATGTGAPPPGAPAFGGPDYGAQGGFAVSPGSSSSFKPTWGLIIGGVGALFVLLSLFVLDFAEASGFGGGSGPLGDLNEEGVSGLTRLYANGFIRFLVLLIVLAAAVTMARIPAIEDKIKDVRTKVPNLAMIAAIVCGVLLLWHLVVMFTMEVEFGGDSFGLDPTFGAWLGALGWIGLGVSQLDLPFNKQTIGS